MEKDKTADKKVTATKVIFVIHSIYVVLGSVFFIHLRKYQSYCSRPVSDDDLYLLIIFGVIGFIAGILCLCKDCTGKPVTVRLCLVLWHTFLGICIVLSVIKCEDYQGGTTFFIMTAIYITLYILLILAQFYSTFKEDKKVPKVD